MKGISAHSEVDTYMRGLLAERLGQCTLEQQALHNRMYPKGVPFEKLEWAIQQCNNTIAKNNAREAQP